MKLITTAYIKFWQFILGVKRNKRKVYEFPNDNQFPVEAFEVTKA